MTPLNTCLEQGRGCSSRKWLPPFLESQSALGAGLGTAALGGLRSDIQPRLSSEASKASLALVLTPSRPYNSAVEAVIPLPFLVCLLFGNFLFF